MVWQKYSNQDVLKHFVDTFIQIDEIKDHGIYHENMEELIHAVKACFHFLEASGGLVSNAKEEVLFIHRLGVWDLPKGKMEPNETPELTAIREVREECGLSALSIRHKITETYHIYRTGGKTILKCTHWYRMTSTDTTPPTPQLSENIIDVKWIPAGQIRAILQDSYPSVCEVIQKEFNLLFI